MKQFCPECCKWYDLDSHFCPKCDVVVYSEEECNDTLKRGKILKIVPHTKVNKMFGKGSFFLSLGIAFIVVLIIWSSINNNKMPSLIKNPTEIILDCIPGVLVLGSLVLIFFGIKYISSYKYLNKKLKTRPVIICPYCHSSNTIKITTLNRAGSIMLTGVSSGKIGKQWHCNDCTSDF